MNEHDESEKPKAPRDGVANELIDELHEANKKLTHAREHIDEAQKADIGGLTKRDRASDEVREAEKEIEKADAKIREELKAKEKA